MFRQWVIYIVVFLCIVSTCTVLLYYGCTGSSTTIETAADSTDKSQLLKTNSEPDNNDISEHCQDNKSEPFVSAVCDKRFKKKQHLKAERQSHIGPKFYSCTQCDKRFSLRNSLYQHMNIHKSKYKCTDCGRCFISNYVLAKHRQSHTGVKPFECTVCGRRFMRARYLVEHSRTHSGEKPYKCHMCDKAFSQCGSRNVHMRVHAGPYNSSQSNKSFSQVSDVKKHISREETNKRSCRCPYCRKLFKTNSLLKQHVRVHTGEKPFSCRHCSDCFMWQWQLKQHLLKSHSQGIWLICDICQKHFSDSCNFNVHLPVFEHKGTETFVFSECTTDIYTVYRIRI